MFYHYTNKSDYCILCLFVDDFSIVSTRHKTQSRDDFLKKISAISTTPANQTTTTVTWAFAAGDPNLIQSS